MIPVLSPVLRLFNYSFGLVAYRTSVERDGKTSQVPHSRCTSTERSYKYISLRGKSVLHADNVIAVLLNVEMHLAGPCTLAAEMLQSRYRRCKGKPRRM